MTSTTRTVRIKHHITHIVYHVPCIVCPSMLFAPSFLLLVGNKLQNGRHQSLKHSCSFFFAHRASTLLQRTHLFAAHPPLCPLAQCLSQQWTFFGCVEGIKWESHLVPGLLVHTW